MAGLVLIAGILRENVILHHPELLEGGLLTVQVLLRQDVLLVIREVRRLRARITGIRIRLLRHASPAGVVIIAEEAGVAEAAVVVAAVDNDMLI